MGHNIGDEIQFSLEGTSGRGIVIGEPSYSTGDVLMVATKNTYGMPINVAHCQRTGHSDKNTAGWWRLRYINRYGALLKRL